MKSRREENRSKKYDPKIIILKNFSTTTKEHFQISRPRRPWSMVQCPAHCNGVGGGEGSYMRENKRGTGFRAKRPTENWRDAASRMAGALGSPSLCVSINWGRRGAGRGGGRWGVEYRHSMMRIKRVGGKPDRCDGRDDCRPQNRNQKE